MKMNMFEKTAKEIIEILKAMSTKLAELDKKHAKALSESAKESLKKAA